jgi:hypothetical protein
VVRVFVPADREDPFALAGIVEHVGSGRSLPFRSCDDLIRTVLDELRGDWEAARERSAGDPSR